MTKTTTPNTADLLARTSQEPAAAPPPTELDRVKAELHLMKTALDEIITEATSRNHAIDIARRARHGEGRG